MARHHPAVEHDPVAGAANALRRHTAFLRFAHAAALSSFAVPKLEEAVRLFLAHLCDYRAWHLAHARIFSLPTVGPAVPIDIWHVGRCNKFSSPERDVALERLRASEDRFRRALQTQYACCVALPAKWAIGLKSAFVIPLLASAEPLGVFEFLGDAPAEQDAMLLGILTALGARLGCLIECKLAQRQVRDLSLRLFHLQDEERRRLAQELHDTTGQSITAMIYELDAVERGATFNQAAQDALVQCKALAQQSLREVRTCSYALHPPMLDELGFCGALGIFVENFSRRSGAKITLNLPDSLPSLSREIETALFRVVQEGLTNAQRYAQGSRCEIHLSADNSAVRLIVENEASGNVPSLPDADLLPQAGVGISAARERVEFLGGSLKLRTGTYRTLLEVSIPRPQAMTQSV